MTFKVASYENLNTFMRLIGYKPIAKTPEGQLNCVRPLGADYPRFHAYVKETPDGYVFNLHLDQTRPSYGGGTHAHKGEYDSEIVREERTRIEEVSKNS